MGMDNFQWCVVTEQGQWAEIGMQEVPYKQRKNLFTECVRALEQAAQGSCGVSYEGPMQTLSYATNCREPALAKELDSVISIDPFQTFTIL